MDVTPYRSVRQDMDRLLEQCGIPLLALSRQVQEDLLSRGGEA